MKHYCLVYLVIFFIIFSVKAQTVHVSNFTEYKKSIKKNKNYKLKKIDATTFNFQLDLVYATSDNFTKTIIYPTNLSYTFLSVPAYKALKRIAKKLKKQNLGIKIFDAYRPHSATVKFWEIVPDERYAAHPSKGSNHNRGLAIDITLYDLSTGKELDMGTGFDNFTEKAHHSYQLFSNHILKNRTLLKSMMEEFGFKALDTEWWHYSYQSKLTFSILDIPFETLYNQ